MEYAFGKIKKGYLMKKVLVVDDSSTVRRLVKIALVQIGYEVIEACDGDEALTVAKAQKVDLIILDLNMPNKNGFEFLKEFRELNHADTPVIMVTTETAGHFVNQGKELGLTAWLSKPFPPQKLAKVVQHILKSK